MDLVRDENDPADDRPARDARVIITKGAVKATVIVPGGDASQLLETVTWAGFATTVTLAPAATLTHLPGHARGWVMVTVIAAQLTALAVIAVAVSLRRRR